MPSWPSAAAHLAVLSTLALAQPLLDVLADNPAFFAVRGSSSAQIVSFGIGLLLLPPAGLIGVQLALARASRRLAWMLQLAFVGLLVAIVTLHLIAAGGWPTGAAALASSVLVGVGAALVYRQARAARMFLTVLAPAPILVAILFFVVSPVSRLVFVGPTDVRAASIQGRTPVVLVVLDELSTTALMNEHQRIDGVRYPNFGALARESTWYRNATTTYWLTEVAVPSVLTGRLPRPDLLPILADYPHNVFTLLGGSYRVRAVETLTSLCPHSYCPNARRTQAVDGGLASLVSDAGVVYLNTVLPDPFVRHVPAITDAWGNFGRDQDASSSTTSGATRGRACARGVCEFLDLISPGRAPSLYVLHTLLPHVPYVYLPSGNRYAADTPVLRGLRNGRWANPWASRQTYRRFLLQLGFADRELGLILGKLRRTGLYERALVIVTADHGVSFRDGAPRRLPTNANVDEIAFVPLFVKLPGQRRGKVDDSLVRNIDVVPTIAQVLGVPIPWRVDGRPLGHGSTATGVRVPTSKNSSLNVGLKRLVARRSRTLARQVGIFGTGSLAGLDRAGRDSALLGRRVDTFTVRTSAAGVELERGTLLTAVDHTSGLVPSYVEGRIVGWHGGGRRIVVAVNGIIRAATLTYVQAGETRFESFVPEAALRSGKNRVEILAVVAGRPTLERLQDRHVVAVLAERDGVEQLEASDGLITSIVPGRLSGTISATRVGRGFRFSGWAADLQAGRPVQSILVLSDGREVFRSRATLVRPHRILGEAAPKKTFGVAFELPAALLPAPGVGHAVRVFAIDGRVASELRHVGRYPWAGP